MLPFEYLTFFSKLHYAEDASDREGLQMRNVGRET